MFEERVNRWRVDGGCTEGLGTVWDCVGKREGMREMMGDGETGDDVGLQWRDEERLGEIGR